MARIVVCWAKQLLFLFLFRSISSLMETRSNLNSTFQESFWLIFCWETWPCTDLAKVPGGFKFDPWIWLAWPRSGGFPVISSQKSQIQTEMDNPYPWISRKKRPFFMQEEPFFHFVKYWQISLLWISDVSSRRAIFCIIHKFSYSESVDGSSCVISKDGLKKKNRIPVGTWA